MGDVSGAQDAVPVLVVSASTNKVAVSRAEAANMLRPTMQAEPLFADDGTPIAIDDAATERVAPRYEAQTSLGVAPLEPATVVRAPFVLNTPSRLALVAKNLVATTEPYIRDLPRVRTAIVPLSRGSGQPRRTVRAIVAGLVQLARRWLRGRRTTAVMRPLAR